MLPGPIHGYGIRREVHRLSEGTLKLGIGNVYTQLERYQEKGLVAPVTTTTVLALGREATVEGPGRRKLYELTDSGRELLFEEDRRLARMRQALADTLAQQEQQG